MRAHRGIVQKGAGRAAALGFPTANIALGDPTVSGVYAARVAAGNKSYAAAAYADRKRKVLEAHIIEGSDDLYGKEVLIELLLKIRDASSFDSDDALRAAIADDVKKAREYFANIA